VKLAPMIEHRQMLLRERVGAKNVLHSLLHTHAVAEAAIISATDVD